MPPEPLPWDRKDFFKERKHERSESLGSVARWRESSSHHGGSRGFTRWGSGDFRRPPGYGKQGSWHVFPDDSGHGYAPSRPTDKSSDDDNSRRSVFRGEGKYNRSYRESKGSFGQREWKGTNACEASNGSLNTPERPSDTNNSLRSVDMLVYTSPTHSEPGNTWNCRQSHSKEEQHDKIDDANGLSTGQKFDESSLGSLDWKPLNWSRSGSLSSRGSGLSNSSSSKSMGGVDSNEANDGTVAANVGMLESPTGDAALYGSTANPFEDMASRKKPRLGWGEGLAKYEKKRVDGPEESASKSGAEPTQSLGLSGTEKSPRFASSSDCASPATPSSVACSSSPGLEEKSFGKAMNVDSEVNNLCDSVDPGSQNQLEGPSFNLEKLDLNSLGTLGYSLSEFLQSDDASSVDSSFARSTAASKLLLLKVDLLKTIEVTESEIDSLENELKALTSVARSSCPCTASSSSMPVEISIMRPTPLQITSSGDIGEGEAPLPNGQLEEIHANDKDDDVDSPGTATSKFVEQITLVKSAPSAVVSQCQSPVNFNVSCAVETKINQSASDALRNSMDMIASSDSAMINDINASRGNMLCQLIFSSNKEAAKEASDPFTPLLASPHYNHDNARVHDVNCQDSVLEKFTKRKRFAKFKERVTVIQFRALHHLWKEDLRLLSLKKSRAKSHKKLEPSLRITVNGYQKHRSSARSRFSSPGGSLGLAPTKEMLTYTSKLLSDSRTQQFRASLKMPALISDEREKTASRFLSTNGLVEDPCGFEKERTVINPWTIEEQQIFLDKYATFGKDFTRIASFLDHKTTADCVQFYYKNHKSDLFEKTKKKKHEFGKNGKPTSASTYLVASRKKWDCGVNTVSLDVLGDVSLLAAQADGNMLEEQGVFSRRFSTSSTFSSILDRRETVAADVLAGSFSSEAMGSCVTSSLEPLTPGVMENVEEETCSGESCGEMEDPPPDWTDEERAAFMEAVSSYGKKDFSMISRHVGTRSVGQCKVFFSKARKCLGLDAAQQPSSNNGCIGSPDSDDSDAEEDCVVKMDEDLPCSARKADVDSCEPLKSNEEAEPIIGRGDDAPCSTSSTTDTEADTPGAGFSLNLEPKEEQQLCLKQRARSLPPEAAIDWFEKSNVRDRFEGNGVSGISSELQILQGYPIQVMPNEVSREVMHQSWLSKHPSEDLYLFRKCSSSSCSTRHPDNGPSVTQVKLKQSSSSADTERQPMKSGAGDFKLFGQKILSTDDKGGVSLNPPSSSSLVTTATIMKPNNHLVQHVSSSSSYGFWDGSKIQSTGFSSSLPDSAILLAKYPAAFSNYPPLQQQLTTTTTVKKNGISSNRNGVQMYRNLDGLVVKPPFTVEVKQQHSEMQRCNGLDALQQLVVGGRGGGPCNAVSDPVAAIKMHYAQTELQQQQQQQTGTIIREDETTSWRDR